MSVLFFVLRSFALSLIFVQIFGKILPCEFSFDEKFGYTCRVEDISITSPHFKITKIGGDHFHDKPTFKRNIKDVLRVVMYDRNIDYLPVNLTYYFPYLRTLQVKKCGLKALTRSPDLRTLRRLYLGFNDIKKIPEAYFWHFCRLEILSLHGNQISNIPQMAFRDLISLKRLSLNSNHLVSISSILFTNCLKLEYVDLENNAIKYIERGLFANLTRLQTILMRNNHIEAIENGFLLDLRNNTGLCASFGGNQCIFNFTYPQNGNFDDLQKLFMINCTLQEHHITTTELITTIKPRKKKKHQTPDMIFYENCTWHIHSWKNYSVHFKHGF